MTLKPFGLTHVVYDSEDTLGPIWAIVSLAPPFYVVSVTTVLVIGRDLRAGSVLLGIVWTTLSCTILKKLIDEPRPDHYQGTILIPDSQSGGMPSNHSSCVVFCALICILHQARNVSRKQTKETSLAYQLIQNTKTWILPLILAIVGLACCYSRVHLGYHTPNQVYGGCLWGTLCGLAWYTLYEIKYMTSWGTTLEQNWILEAFGFYSSHDIIDADVTYIWKQGIANYRLQQFQKEE